MMLFWAENIQASYKILLMGVIRKNQKPNPEYIPGIAKIKS